MKNLLTPLKNEQRTSNPTAIFVGVRTKPNGLYDLATKALFPPFVKVLLMGNKRMNELPPHTKDLVEDLEREIKERPEGVVFDDAVSEEIGRILLEYAANVDDKRLAGGGGHTRKCKRKHKFNAKTRSKTRLNKRTNTRKKCKAIKPRCKRTHRA